MLGHSDSASEKRRRLRRALSEDRLLRFPGAFNPLTALTVETVGFDGVYVSGAALSAVLGLPDIGITTLDEVSRRAGEIARTTALPTIVDADVGFGGPLNVARTVEKMEESGLAGMHLEDQVSPKRCGHLDNKTLVPARDMVHKIRAAVAARSDRDFLIIARTDARACEGLEAAIDRAKAYVDAGAEMIFPEALADTAEFAAFRKALNVPLLANMTEFGKSELLDAATLQSIGFDMVIYPVTTLRLAMKAIADGLAEIAEAGHQRDLVGRMQTRRQLYDLLGYEDYAVFDQSIADFEQ